VKPQQIAGLAESMLRNIGLLQQRQRTLFILALHRHSNPTTKMRTSVAPYTPICPFPIVSENDNNNNNDTEGVPLPATLPVGYSFSSNPASFYHSPYSPPSLCALTNIFGASPIFDRHCLPIIFEFAAFSQQTRNVGIAG
jgi:hypothetical protein